MTFHEFFAFILPEFDVIQLLFGGTMLFLVALTLVLLHFQANHHCWEKKWQGDSLNNDAGHLNAEHGSVNEISAAVASPAEKMADVMPGILLILGLLGTFLGLGIALNKASDILIDANSAGMDNAMSNLMGMMEGLGTKFKTSTWGILAFLILKTWVAARGYDEKRLRWCAQQMKQVFDRSREKNRAEHEQTQLQFLAALQGLNDRIQLESEATRQSFSLLSAGMEPLLQTLIDQQKAAAKQSEIQESHLAELTDVSRSTQQQLIKSLQAVASCIREESETSRQENHSRYTEAAALSTRMVAQADEAARQRSQQVTELATTRESLQRFIDTNSSNLTAIQHSAGKMSAAAQGMGDSAGDLQQVISDFRTGIADVLETVKSDLGSTISQMGESFSQNMGSISTSMANATDGISGAVTDLSQNVGNTMSEVRLSIEQSMKTQRAAQAEFIMTSETLNEKVMAMTKLVDDLREQIVNGLAAISTGNRKVADLNNRYVEVSASGERNAVAIEALVNQLQGMQKENPLQPGVDMITADVGKLVQGIEALRDEMLNGALEELGAIREMLSSPERDRFVLQIEQTLIPLAATLKSLEQTLIAMNTIDDAA